MCFRIFKKTKNTHSKNSSRGFDVHYIDQSINPKKSIYCGKEFSFEETAWNYAKTLKDENKENFIDIFVVYSLNNKPVIGYKEKISINLG